MPAVRKGFLHTNIQYYKISPVHLAAQINRFTDSFLGPELVMGCWESSELLGILDFHFSRNGMCVAGHPEISLDDKRSGNKELTPSPQLSCWHRRGAEGGMQGSTFLAGCSLNPRSLPNVFQFLPYLGEQHLHRCDKQNMLWGQVEPPPAQTPNWSWWTLCQCSSQLQTSH